MCEAGALSVPEIRYEPARRAVDLLLARGREIDATRARLAQAEAERDAAREALVEVSDALQQAIADRDDAKSLLADCRNDLDRARAELFAAQDDLSRARGERDGLRSRIRAAVEELEG